MKILMKAVDMICFSTTDGKLTPLKFRIKDNDSNYKVIKIDRIVSCEEEKLAGNRMLIYKVESLLGEKQQLYEIKYEFTTCKWFLYKM